jgi:hypothetical protein
LTILADIAVSAAKANHRRGKPFPISIQNANDAIAQISSPP